MFVYLSFRLFRFYVGKAAVVDFGADNILATTM